MWTPSLGSNFSLTAEREGLYILHSWRWSFILFLFFWFGVLKVLWRWMGSWMVAVWCFVNSVSYSLFLWADDASLVLSFWGRLSLEGNVHVSPLCHMDHISIFQGDPSDITSDLSIFVKVNLKWDRNWNGLK